MKICPPTGTGVKLHADDLFSTPLDQPEIDFENAGGETYICGNPPYKGSQWQGDEQKNDLEAIFDGKTRNWGSLDYVSGWLMKAADYGTCTKCTAAFVCTKTVCQGRHIENLWPAIIATSSEIDFAYASFEWSNLASHNAGVTVAIVGITREPGRLRRLFGVDNAGQSTVKEVANINAYLVPAPNVVVKKASTPISEVNEMTFGNMPNDGGFLLVESSEAGRLLRAGEVPAKFVRPFVGSYEYIHGLDKRCIWVHENDFTEASDNKWLRFRFEAVKRKRSESDRATTIALAELPYRFGEVRQTGSERTIVIPGVSSQSREYLPCGLLPSGTIISNKNFAIFDGPLWNLALLTSKLHIVWIATVCVRLRTDYSYSNTLGWNTFPVPPLSEQNKADLTRCAEEILLAREAHFPATIADLYDPEAMPADLRAAHDRNDETLERIYIGRRFKNDTERLEKLFELYTQMIEKQKKIEKPASKRTQTRQSRKRGGAGGQPT